jgi:hypothetical protein
VQQRRELQVKLIQRFQKFAQDRVVKSALDLYHVFQLPLVAQIALKLP